MKEDESKYILEIIRNDQEWRKYLVQKVEELHRDVTLLKVRAGVWGGVSAALVTLILNVKEIVKYLVK